MKTNLSISLAFALAVTAATSAAQTIEGILDCGTWIEARKENSAGALEHYFLGLLNGLAVGRGVDIWRGQGTKMTRAQAYLWLDNYCRTNALSDVPHGAVALADEKTAGEFGRTHCAPR